jgi:phosphatidylglycerol lysyltransferase
MLSIRLNLKERSIPFLQENGKLIAQFVFASLFIGLAWWFIHNERAELGMVRHVLSGASLAWIIAGLLLVVVYILLQALMYVASFASVHARLKLSDALILFLKRNLISVFLPAGGVSSLAFYSRAVEKEGISKTQIYYASSIYGFVGILSVVVVAIPAFIYALSRGSIGGSEWIALVSSIALLLAAFIVYKSLLSKGKLYRFLLRWFPNVEVFFDEFQNQQTRRSHILLTVFLSVLIEFVGIAHVYIATAALGYTPSVFVAVMAYLVVVVFLIVSPFLRGLGAIEVSMTYVLTRFGFENTQAIAIMILFRFFEFWLPLVSGLVTFVLKIDKLLMRVLPSFLLLTLGVVNIVSVLTPAITERVKVLNDFVYPEVITSSNQIVLIIGLLLLVTAVFMLKGLRTAWWMALLFSCASFIGHITKGIDYEEASIALLIIVVLLFTHKEYYVKTNPKLRIIGIQTAVLSVVVVFIYGIVGFYFLDKKHFDIDFSFLQSVKYTFQNYFLVGSSDLVPGNNFARDFMLSIKGSGLASMLFLIYTLVRPYVLKEEASEEEVNKAKETVEKYGRSSLDFFKTYSDKLLFWASDNQSFVSYRVSGNFAVALENPVAESEMAMQKCIEEFGKYCYENGLKDIYYRVPQESLPIYQSYKKKTMFLGQEGVVDTFAFTLEGREVKSIRNAVRKITEMGYVVKIVEPPLLDGTIQKLQTVSNDWLKLTERSEIVFSQGIFCEEEIKQQTVITVENNEEKVIAFANIIPDYAPNEGTYDLMRKTIDAPNGIMDFVLVEIIKYFQSKNIQYVNIGFAPLSGLDDPHSFPEKSMKFAYDKIRSFSHYKGMREYKEKFNPVWYDKYLVYNQDYDLIQVPVVLSKVIKP